MPDDWPHERAHEERRAEKDEGRLDRHASRSSSSRCGDRLNPARSAGTLEPTKSRAPRARPRRRRRSSRRRHAGSKGHHERDDLDDDGRGDDPREAGLPPRQVVPDQQVGDGEKPDGDRKGSKYLAALCELRPECHRDESDTRSCVDQCEQAAKRDGRQQRSSEDVLGRLASRLAGGSPRKQNGQDRGREEKTDSCEG